MHCSPLDVFALRTPQVCKGQARPRAAESAALGVHRPLSIVRLAAHLRGVRADRPLRGLRRVGALRLVPQRPLARPPRGRHAVVSARAAPFARAPCHDGDPARTHRAARPRARPAAHEGGPRRLLPVAGARERRSVVRGTPGTASGARDMRRAASATSSPPCCRSSTTATPSPPPPSAAT